MNDPVTLPEILTAFLLVGLAITVVVSALRGSSVAMAFAGLLIVIVFTLYIARITT